MSIGLLFIYVVPVSAGTTWIPAQSRNGVVWAPEESRGGTTTWIPARQRSGVVSKPDESRGGTTTWIPSKSSSGTYEIPSPPRSGTTWTPLPPRTEYTVWGDRGEVMGKVIVYYRDGLVFTDYDFDEPYHCRLQSITTAFNHASYTYGVHPPDGQSLHYPGTYIAPRDAVLAFDINNTSSYPAGHFTSYLTFDCEGRRMNARTSSYPANTSTFKHRIDYDSSRGDVYHRDNMNESVYRESESQYGYKKYRLWQKWYGNRW